MSHHGKHKGIVLKKIHKSRIAIIDEILGRIDGSVLIEDISAGTLLTYEIQEKSYGYVLNGLSIEDMPLSLAPNNLLFLHHVLELCYYFIPVHADGVSTFNLLCLLYQPFNWTSLNQKLFIFRILTALGFYPESLLISDKQLTHLHSLSIDIIQDEPIDLECEQLLDQWLCHCIAQHPKIECFNTMHFLTKNKRYE